MATVSRYYNERREDNPEGGRNDRLLARNINGTTNHHGDRRRKCRCGSWIQHWYNNTNSNRETCCVLGCTRPCTKGAHVQLDDDRSFDNEWYIVPFCAKHNNRANTKQMWLDARVRAVSANVHEMGCAADIRRKDSPGSGPGSGYNSRGGSPGRGSGCDSGYNSPW